MSRRLMFRMIAPVAAISALLLVLGGAAAWNVHRLQKDVSEVLALNVASVRAAEELEIGLLEIRGHLKDYLYTGERKHLAAITVFRRQTDFALREAERLATTPQEEVLVAQITRAYERFFRQLDRITEQGGRAGHEREEVRTLIETDLRKEILKPAREYLDHNERLAVRNSEQNQANTRLMVLALLLLGTSGAVAGLVTGYGIARGVARSIGQLSRPIQAAAGKLDEVAGPAHLSAGQELPDLEANLQRVARQADTVVERLHASQREVLRAEQLAAVGQMAAGLAHELRNPLMSMKILVQPAAVRGSAVNLSERDLEVLNEEITRLETLIQTVLDFARPPQPEKRPFELQEVLAQTAVLVSGRAGQLGVSIVREGPEGRVEIEADLGQVRQVFLNLLLNALDAAPEGGQVTVRVLRGPDAGGRKAGEDGPGEWVAVQVADTGRGLPAKLGSRIFEPFVSTKETGLGLGLSICKRIVEAHGGEITAEDREGEGAVFTVRLPVRGTGPCRPGGKGAAIS